ncbi:MAG: GHKL domain-containing protein [Eubacteriales bacterium]|nr:GHKL domain-containing protein [Eubacteriales bacterium]
MLNKKEYEILSSTEESNKELYDILMKQKQETLKEISIASHDISNYVSYLKTAHQLINKRNPELKENTFFNNMGTTIQELIKYMSRLSQYRYSMKNYELKSVSLEDILYDIPDAVDEVIMKDNDGAAPENSDKFSSAEYIFNVADDLPSINCSYEHLLSGLREVVINALEASDNGKITMSAEKDSNKNKVIYISIINSCNTENAITEDSSVLSQPFYTTKDKHAGVGLSILNQICLTYGFNWTISTESNITELKIVIPV